MASKTHPSNRHHVHTLRDARELLEQMGFTYDEGCSYETGREFSAISVEMTTGLGNPRRAASVFLDKKTQALTITDNTK